MPKPITVRIPLPQTNPSFARRARQSAGLGAIFTKAPVVPFGPNVFVRPRGMGAILTKAPVNPFGPNVFVRPRGMGALVIPAKVALPGPNVFPRGMGSFFIQASPPPVFPGKNIFIKFASGKKGMGCSQGCSGCSQSCSRRGMGDTFDENYAFENPSTSDYDLSGGTSILSTPIFSPVTSTPVSTSTTDYGTLLSSEPLATLNPTGYATSETNTSNAQVQAASLLAQGLTPTQTLATVAASQTGSTGSLSTAQIASLASSLGMTAAQVAKTLGSSTGTPAQPTTPAPAGQQYTYNAQTGQWTLTSTSVLTQLTTWATQNMGTLLLLGGGIFAVSLISGKKGKR